MEERKSVNKEKKLKIADVLHIAEGQLKEAGFGEAFVLALLNLFKGAVVSLRDHIAQGGTGAGNAWENAFLEMDFLVDAQLTEEEEGIDESKELSEKEAVEFLKKILHHAVTDLDPDNLQDIVVHTLTREVLIVIPKEGEVAQIRLPEDLTEEVENLPEDKRAERLEELSKGFEFQPLTLTGTVDTPAGRASFSAGLSFAIRPLIFTIEDRNAFFPVIVGLDFTEGDPSAWSKEDQSAFWDYLIGQIDALAEPHLKAFNERGEKPPAIPKPSRVETFNVAGGYIRPIFGLSEKKKDLPLLLEFHEPQTPLNWAVGLALFSLTDADRVRAGDWQEASIQDIVNRIFCLTERDIPRHGQHREDFLAELVKLHTRKNWYYEIDTIRVGRAWTKRATIGSQYAIPEIQFVFLDKKTGKLTFPSDPAIRQLLIPLEVKGRRVAQPDGKDIPSLPKGRWELQSVRWRWTTSFNEDLLLTPALEESGRRKGLPKKTTTGKIIRKGYLIKVADNVLHALGRLRAEGSGSKYACRLLIMLASNLNKTEDGIAAERVFRMLGIPDDYKTKGHRNPETLVAEAVLRLKSRDIQALLAGSDEYPRTDPNPDRRKGPYYCFKRSPEYTPRSGIVSKEDALAIEAEYEITDKTPSPDISPKAKVAAQLVLPGIVQEAPSIPSGAEIRAAREAAGMNLRDFAKDMKSGSHNTWAKYERGEPIRIKSIAPEAWDRVRAFIAQHGKNVHRK